MPAPWHAHLLLLDVPRIDAALSRLRDGGRFPRVPNRWQIELGVLRMWHRILFRSESVGLSKSFPARKNWRAKLLEWRPLRFPFLLHAGSVAFWDLSGLLSRPEKLIRHLVGTHHDGVQFIYDLEVLASHPGMLQRLVDETRAIVDIRDNNSRYFADLVVYEGYHETLLGVAEAALQGADPGALSGDPDISFHAYLAWCARQPETPEETLALWRAGRYHPQHGVQM